MNESSPLMEKFNLDPFKESKSVETEYNFYTEAVFTNGRKSLSTLEEKWKIIIDKLNDEVNNHGSKFDPKKFWRFSGWKDLEDEYKKVFGFRLCQIQPYQEHYSSREDIFESRSINAMTYLSDRYAIQGLVTENGFYDKSHSIELTILVTLGLVKASTPGQMVAVILHEIGHNIDPALVDIKYTAANVLSKYLTERNAKLTRYENDFVKKLVNIGEKAGLKEAIKKDDSNGDEYREKKNVLGVVDPADIIMLVIALFWIFFPLIVDMADSIKEFFIRLFKGKKGLEEYHLKKVKKAIDSELDLYNRKDNSEAFADNFARMYGYGVDLAKFFKVFGDDTAKFLKRIKKEKTRQEIIISYTISAIRDVHKTDVHRIRNLIREYEQDLKDPDIPENIKAQIREDKELVEKFLNEYLNNYSEFQNRVNNLINERISKNEKRIDAKNEKLKESQTKEEKKEDNKEEKKENNENKNESYEVDSDYNYFEKKSHGKLKSAFRIACNVDNGHMVRIVFELDKDKVTWVGDETSLYGFKADEQERQRKAIHKVGNNNFEGRMKVKAIVDMDTKEQLKSVTACGILRAGWTPYEVPKDIREKYKEELGDNSGTFSYLPVKAREEIVKRSPQKQKGDKFVVGEYEPGSSYKSTKPANNLSDIATIEHNIGYGYSRGTGVNHTNMGIKTDKYYRNVHILTRIKNCEEEVNKLNKIIEANDKVKSNEDVQEDLAYVKTGINELKELANKYSDEKYNQVDSNPLYKQRYNNLRDSIIMLKRSIRKAGGKDILKESFDEFDEMTNTEKALKLSKERKKSLTSSERAQLKEKFGNVGCSFAKDKNGYYCYTHRARSKSYESIDKIPKKDVDFVNSTC